MLVDTKDIRDQLSASRHRAVRPPKSAWGKSEKSPAAKRAFVRHLNDMNLSLKCVCEIAASDARLERPLIRFTSTIVTNSPYAQYYDGRDVGPLSAGSHSVAKRAFHM